MTEACTTDQQDSPAPDALVDIAEIVTEIEHAIELRKNGITHLFGSDILPKILAALSRPDTVQAAVDAERERCRLIAEGEAQTNEYEYAEAQRAGSRRKMDRLSGICEGAQNIAQAITDGGRDG